MIGWFASLIMRTDAQQGVLMNVLVGVVGSALGGLLIAPVVGMPTLTEGGGINMGSLLVALAGTVILLGLWNLLRRGSVR